MRAVALAAALAAPLLAVAAVDSWLEQLSSFAQLATLQKLGVLTPEEHDAVVARLDEAEQEASSRSQQVVLLAPPPSPSLPRSLAQLAALQQAALLSDSEYAQAKSILLRDAGNGSTLSDADAPDATPEGSVTWEELAQHNTKEEPWVAIHDDVYDFSCFFAQEPCYEHPGGTEIILEWAGKDGTEAFA
eukprot:COSAG02_NODE_17903_length_972_cov_1.304696_1_plen_188_part_01